MFTRAGVREKRFAALGELTLGYCALRIDVTAPLLG
jgi:hypothetical protein